MKKVLCVVLAIAFWLVTIPAMANFKVETHEAIIDNLKGYFAVEQGNRLSRYSFQTLINEINDIFKRNMVIPPRPQPESETEKNGPPDK